MHSFFPSMPFCGDCQQKVWPRFRASLPISNDLVKKTLHRHVQLLEFQLISDAINWTNKISHHMSLRGQRQGPKASWQGRPAISLSSEFDIVPLNKVEENSRVIPNINLRPLSSHSQMCTHTCSHTYAHRHISMDIRNYIKREEMGSRQKKKGG